ncbi:MAG TPA: NRDE family protein [Chitinophagaceae bacterium]|nr:NRDE family protein [Chitinophagaceae bacterium]
MCTVTFIPAKEHIILTSNRDEKHWRSPAHAPARHAFTTGNILFPKDGDAGGTWFAVHENGNAVIFLNGGFVRHEPAPPYRRSRGLVLLDLLDSASPRVAFQNTSLENIEPFTAIIWDDGRLFECRWDGSRRHAKEMDREQPHIWSSVTLYDEQVIAKRKQWFADWLQQHTMPGQEDILHFHQFTGDGDAHNDLMMNRDGKVFTVSVTSAVIRKGKANLTYVDLNNKLRSQEEIVFIHSSLAKA